MSHENMEHRWDYQSSWTANTFRRPTRKDERTRKENEVLSNGSRCQRCDFGLSLAGHIQTTVLLERHLCRHEHTPDRNPITGLVYADPLTIHPSNKSRTRSNHSRYTHRMNGDGRSETTDCRYPIRRSYNQLHLYGFGLTGRAVYGKNRSTGKISTTR